MGQLSFSFMSQFFRIWKAYATCRDIGNPAVISALIASYHFFRFSHPRKQRKEPIFFSALANFTPESERRRSLDTILKEDKKKCTNRNRSILSLGWRYIHTFFTTCILFSMFTNTGHTNYIPLIEDGNGRNCQLSIFEFWRSTRPTHFHQPTLSHFF